eukprot:GEMP01004798.1.p1 GENE.GEMP01004798.1~~GEMP01004798.1.p1  ORF type:complete len:1067 (+),score=271.95 GEMP01004798.1:195-3395(+)
MRWGAKLWLCDTFLVAANLGQHNFGFGDCSGLMEEIAECEEKACESKNCVDCEWGEWSHYTSCTCEGLQERSRSIKAKNDDCGKPCSGNRIETQNCMPSCHKSPVDCRIAEWSIPVECDKDCGGGQTFRERTITRQSEFGGKACDGVLKESFPCNDHTCYAPQDCTLAPWGQWDECSASCYGTQRRERSVATVALYGGQPCEANMAETRPCNEHACGKVVDCEWDAFSEWSACSVTCGGGDHARSRSVKIAPRLGGRTCDAKTLTEVEVCMTQSCEEQVNCKFGSWTEWDACSCTCNGIQHRVRHVERYPQKGGKICEGNLREVRGCNTSKERCEAVVSGEMTLPPTTTPLPMTTTTTTPAPLKPTDHTVKVNCKISDWTAWEECSASCDGGVHTRSRHVLQEPSAIGNPCDAALRMVESCNTQECETPQLSERTPAHAATDCKMSPWTKWGVCSATCGGGEHKRTRQIAQAPNSLGKPCDAQGTFEMDSCNTHGCECIDCQWGAWSNYGACTCTGLRERHRVVTRHYSGCGKICEGSKTQTQKCQPNCGGNTQDCVLSDWCTWTECSKTCGGGTHRRERSIVKESLNGGRGCIGDLVDVAPCNAHHCGDVVNCQVTSWGNWETCSVSCDGGQQVRNRSVKTQAANNGTPCNESLQEIRGCNTDACGSRQDCKWGEWSEYSACSESCSGGHKNRDRSIMIAPRFGGKMCEAKSKSETAPCNTRSCDVGCIDATWGSWTEWGECSASCGVSYRMRSRTVGVQANHCGQPLEGDMQEFVRCEDVVCKHTPIDCQFSTWSVWSDCSCSCNGLRYRSRRVKAYDQNGGKECAGALKELSSCNTHACNVQKVEDCKLSDWNPWTICNAECGGGQQTRTRKVEQYSSNKGKPCEATLVEMRGCNIVPCTRAINCEWGQWNGWSACSHKCGGGHQNRLRQITRLPKSDGKACEPGASAEMRRCNMQPCGSTHYCGWDAWAKWGACSRTCGEGQKKRERRLKISVKKPEKDDLLFTGSLDDIGVENQRLRLNVGKFFSVFIAGALFSSIMFTAYSRMRGGRHIIRDDFELIRSS